MTKSSRSKEYASAMADKWARYEADNLRNGLEPFSLEHKLSIAWRQGFEAGQRHQVKIQKEKNK